MKLLIVFACFVLAINASTEEELWLKFKQDHGKTYKSLREEKLRFTIFKSNLKAIDEHNARFENGDESWAMAVNRFADLTNEEFEAQYLSVLPNDDFHATHTFQSLNAPVPDSVDWREKAVLSVKDQESCGSCWAFSAIGALEGQNALKHNIKVDLSEQELVDCSGSFKNEGCDGGWMEWAFDYIKENGISTFADYRYVARDEKCRAHSNSAKVKVTGYTSIKPTNETDLKQAVGTVGPVSIAINGRYIQFYSHGIFNNVFCSSALNHGVLAVGYGNEDGKDYWIVKNSWGRNWGDHGFIKMSRNHNNQCGIASRASYPNLE